MYGRWGLDNSSLFPPEQAACQGPEKESDLSGGQRRPAVLITHMRNCSVEDLLEKGSAAGQPNRNSNNTADNIHAGLLVSQLTVVFHPAAYSVTSKSHFDLQVQ